MNPDLKDIQDKIDSLEELIKIGDSNSVQLREQINKLYSDKRTLMDEQYKRQIEWIKILGLAIAQDPNAFLEQGGLENE